MDETERHEAGAPNVDPVVAAAPDAEAAPDTEAAPNTETAPDTEAVLEAGITVPDLVAAKVLDMEVAVSDTETVSESGATAAPEPEAATVPELEAAVPETQAAAAPITESVPKSDAAAWMRAELVPATEAMPATELVPDLGAIPDTEAAPGADAAPDTEAKATAIPEPQALAVTGTDPVRDLDIAVPKSDSAVPGAEAAPGADAVSDTDAAPENKAVTEMGASVPKLEIAVPDAGAVRETEAVLEAGIMAPESQADPVPAPDAAAWVKAEALSLGFDMAGVTDVRPSDFAAEYRDWIEDGCAGEMEYLKRNLDRRLDPAHLLEGALSLVVVGMNYYCDTEEGPGTPNPDPGGALFARYARGDDYHDVMERRLKDLLARMKVRFGDEVSGRVYVDAGPVLEREAAHRAGLGWFGKNTMLINTRRGSYFLLGEIVTNLQLSPDAPTQGGCGTCRRCIDACPTGAITAPYRVDARRCISYLTIEQKGAIPAEFAPALAVNGNRVFGCDICQEVCPFNIRRAAPTDNPAFQTRAAIKNARLTDLLAMTEEEFREAFRKSPVKRAKHRGLMRNVEAAASARTTGMPRK